MTSELHGSIPRAQATPQNTEALGQSWTDLEALHAEVSSKLAEQRVMQILSLKLTGADEKGVFGRAVMQKRM